jgi:hypothetical protein
MISASAILLYYVVVGLGISMFIEKQAIKQEMEVSYYCKEVKKSLKQVQQGKTEEAKVIASSLQEDLNDGEKLLGEMVEKRQYYTGFSGTLHAMFCWPFVGLFSVGKMIINRK